MHDTAALTAKAFFEVYGSSERRTILEVGSMNVNGALRDCVGPDADYYGVDIASGPGVDRIIDDPGKLPFLDESFDLVVSSSCLEHDDFFWLTFGEMCRVVRAGGFVYMSAPANGVVHQHPVDCWRFYPDAGLALARWGRKLGHSIVLIESFLLPPRMDQWIDFVAIFGKRPESSPRISPLFPEAQHLRTEIPTVTCPICKETFKPFYNDHEAERQRACLPFCSQVCRDKDLGAE